MKPKGFWRRVWWWLTRHVEMETVRYSGTWRRWKKMAKESEREMIAPRDRGLPKHGPNVARRKRRAAAAHWKRRRLAATGTI